MQEASIPGLIRTILIMIGVYYAIKFLSRLFLPVLFRELAHKAQENFNKQQEDLRNMYQNNTYNDSHQYSQTSKNDIPKPTKQVGDYIDYEEVND